jgi:hypothetical protein
VTLAAPLVDARATAGPAIEPCLPAPAAWREAAARHADRFAPLVPGARIGLLARSSPARMLVWEATQTGIDVRIEDFGAYASCTADIVLAADDAALREIHDVDASRIFVVLRAGIRTGDIVCYWLTRRCVLEQLGFDELLDALGFAFMGACR